MKTTAMKDIPHLDWQTLFRPAADMPAEQKEILDVYFRDFAQPPFTTDADGKNNIGKVPCLKCGEPLMGDIADVFTGRGGFTWGIAHGEGHCRDCSWPARAYHFIKTKDGKDFATLRNVVLQYHPDVVSERKR